MDVTWDGVIEAKDLNEEAAAVRAVNWCLFVLPLRLVRCTRCLHTAVIKVTTPPVGSRSHFRG